ncbi:uncharacterized protein MYCFIDRAFT_171627 [Pseudocercospora fijiensis CIRAD86]|uniref:Uncharacterized protein n=1 Tax=Pseudocercospora fijiensis (strain CIRAD86) TaxID=383855 RepID=M3B8V7_PSEFD|nr:uncharacterized protein MYCFIDRAFT_171627 [Pseudocercospora fijiensis CIRAD86]EME85752.1 hypothetical protein MYCFIDRAFT_171627 [Pseudocercospora fijiensis CIRAD86]
MAIKGSYGTVSLLHSLGNPQRTQLRTMNMATVTCASPQGCADSLQPSSGLQHILVYIELD